MITKRLTETEKKDAAKKIAGLKEIDHQKVTGIFINRETPGAELRFYFYKYEGDSLDPYVLRDGERYTLPLMVVNHLRNNCFTEEHKHRLSDSGKEMPESVVGRKEYRFDFRLTDFRPVDGWQEPSMIITPN